MIDSTTWRDFLDHAISESRPSRYVTSPFDDEFVLQEASRLGVDVSDHIFRIDSSRIRHIISRHGKPVHEPAVGQIQLTTWHLEEIPQVLLKPHRVLLAPKFKQGTPALCRCRDYFEEGVANVIVELRLTNQGKYLVFQTMYWRRPG